MTMSKPPRRFLKDSFEYHEFVGLNDWNESEFAEPILIENCRIDSQTEYRITPNGREILFDSLIFVYNGITEPILDFKEQSKITFDGEEKIIVKVIKNHEPYKDEIYSIEIEVI